MNGKNVLFTGKKYIRNIKNAQFCQLAARANMIFFRKNLAIHQRNWLECWNTAKHKHKKGEKTSLTCQTNFIFKFPSTSGFFPFLFLETSFSESSPTLDFRACAPKTSDSKKQMTNPFVGNHSLWQKEFFLCLHWKTVFLVSFARRQLTRPPGRLGIFLGGGWRHERTNEPKWLTEIFRGR